MPAPEIAGGATGGGSTGIVLAGGASRRFGRDKLREPVGGLPLLHRSLFALASCCDEILVSVPSEGELPEMPSDVDVVLVRDERPDEGPLAGLASALRDASNAIALVVGGDMPDLSPDVLRLLKATLEAAGSARMAVLEDGGTARPLPCAIRVDAGPLVVAMVDAGERRLKSLLGLFEVVGVPETAWVVLDPDRGSLRDIDRPEDLR